MNKFFVKKASFSSGAVNIPALFIFLVLVLVVLGGTFWFYTQEANDSAAVPTPRYLIVKGIVVNLLDEDNDAHYMQLEVAIMTRSQKGFQALEAYSPVIRSVLVDLFSEQNFQQMAASGSHQVLQQKAFIALQGVSGNILPQKIERVLITSMIVQ